MSNPPPSPGESSRSGSANRAGVPPSKQQQQQQQQEQRQVQQIQQLQSEQNKSSKQEDDMTMCFDMDDGSEKTPSSTTTSTPDAPVGFSRAPNPVNAPTDYSAASSAQRIGSSSFGFVPPHLLAEQHDF